MVNELSFREKIYDLLTGAYDLDSFPVSESKIVEYVFFEGSFCDTAYCRMLAAYSRLCQRSGSKEWEDPDAEVMISQLMSIGKFLALKMFEYGVWFAGNPAGQAVRYSPPPNQDFV